MKLKYRVIERFRDTYPVKAMCEAFEVSRSGYYSWCKVQKEMPKDQWLVDLIVECQQQCNQTYGIRRVRRLIQRQKEKAVNSRRFCVSCARPTCLRRFDGEERILSSREMYSNNQSVAACL